MYIDVIGTSKLGCTIINIMFIYRSVYKQQQNRYNQSARKKLAKKPIRNAATLLIVLIIAHHAMKLDFLPFSKAFRRSFVVLLMWFARVEIRLLASTNSKMLFILFVIRDYPVDHNKIMTSYSEYTIWSSDAEIIIS